MKRPVVTFATVALLVAPGPASAQAPLEILHGFTLIDGIGGEPVPDAAIAVRGQQIVDTGARARLLAEAADTDAILIDLGGGYVIPGLIDTHVHLATTPNRAAAETELERLLFSGVTAVRDMAGDTRALASLARDASLGAIAGPDIYYSALVAGPSFFTDSRPRASTAGAEAGKVPWMQAVTEDTDMVIAIAQARGTSATGIKIYADLDPSQVERITDEAHRQGMPVWAHTMVFPTRPLEVIRSGVDVVSHVCGLAWEAMAEAPREYHQDLLPEYASASVEAQVFDELLVAMTHRGTILDATLAMYARQDSLYEAGEEHAPALRCDTEFARRMVHRAHREGVMISAGTDFTADPADPFPALVQELEELVDHGGFTPLEAIEAATRIAALAIGIEDGHGTLQPGTALTFVLLDDDPTQDIRNIRSVREVWKNAERFSRSDYRPVP